MEISVYQLTWWDSERERYEERYYSSPNEAEFVMGKGDEKLDESSIVRHRIDMPESVTDVVNLLNREHFAKPSGR